MKKLIRKWGKSLIVSFDEEDQKIHPKIKEGNVVDLSDMTIEETDKDKHEFAEDQLSGVLANKERMK